MALEAMHQAVLKSMPKYLSALEKLVRNASFTRDRSGVGANKRRLIFIESFFVAQFKEPPYCRCCEKRGMYRSYFQLQDSSPNTSNRRILSKLMLAVHNRTTQLVELCLVGPFSARYGDHLVLRTKGSGAKMHKIGLVSHLDTVYVAIMLHLHVDASYTPLFLSRSYPQALLQENDHCWRPLGSVQDKPGTPPPPTPWLSETARERLQGTGHSPKHGRRPHALACFMMRLCLMLFATARWDAGYPRPLVYGPGTMDIKGGEWIRSTAPQRAARRVALGLRSR